jgi:hypothetical protein
MAIFRKDSLQRERDQLARYFQQLSETLRGSPPQASLAERFHQNPQDFASEYTDINLEQLTDDIALFKVTVDTLKNLKKKAARPIHLG